MFDSICLVVFCCWQVRIQLGQGSAGTVTKTMLKNEGFGAFYKVCMDPCLVLLAFVI